MQRVVCLCVCVCMFFLYSVSLTSHLLCFCYLMVFGLHCFAMAGDSSQEKVDQLSEEEETVKSPQVPMDSSYTCDPSDPYPCQFCDKAFPRLSYLKRHEQVSLAR